MARYLEITPDEMTPAQRRVHDQIIAGRRGRFGGPLQLLIRAPEVCEHAAKLGEHLRWVPPLRIGNNRHRALLASAI
jgi:4-carboxymuconolactone decarboxylase